MVDLCQVLRVPLVSLTQLSLQALDLLVPLGQLLSHPLFGLLVGRVQPLGAPVALFLQTGLKLLLLPFIKLLKLSQRLLAPGLCLSQLLLVLLGSQL